MKTHVFKYSQKILKHFPKAIAFTPMAGNRGRNVRGSVELSVIRPWFLKILAAGRAAVRCTGNVPQNLHIPSLFIWSSENRADKNNIGKT